MTDDTQPTSRTSESPTQRPLADAGPTLGRRSLLRTAGAGAGSLLLGAAATAATAQDDLPRLSVDGNELVTDDGEQVTLRGLNVIDPKRANRMAPARGRDAEQVLDLVTGEGWHPDVVRLPVQPVDIGEHAMGAGPEPPAFDQSQIQDYVETHLDPVIEQCAAAGVYAIVDFHRHRDVAWGDQDAGTVNQALQDEAISFWETVAPRYAEDDHVLYEVYNEPTEPGMWGALGQDWVDDVWYLFLEFVQPIVDEIRASADNVTLVGSPGWSQSPEGALLEPVEGENLAYTYHIYPGHQASQDGDWEDAGINGQGVEAVYEEHPLFVTEWGWNPSLDDDFLSGTVSDFGAPFLEWLESSDAIHWTAWCADVWWEPAMFERAFEGSDEETEHPYEEEIAEDCADRPCEWNLLGRDAGSQEHMGEYVRLALETGGVPENYLDDPEDDESDDAADGTADDGAGDDGNSEEGGDDGLPGFGVGAGLAGVTGGLAYLRRRRVGGTGEPDRPSESD